MKVARICLVAVALAGTASAQWQPRPSGTTARLRGVSAVDRDVAWAGGANNTCLRTVDGGATWRSLAPAGPALTDFRDLHAFDDRSACLLSIGPGDASRIYRTDDAGGSWSLRHTNGDPMGFLDAIAFWDRDHGLALGDPVAGRFVILATDDGGRTWARQPPGGMPEALPHEGAFAASGTCLVVRGDSDAWFGTGGGASARVFRSTDRGRNWAAEPTPIRAGNPSSGVFSMAFLDARRGVAVGGDYKATGDSAAVAATTADGGRTWTPAGPTGPSGFRSAVAIVPGLAGPTVLAVGPSGADVSRDGGRTWSPIGSEGFHALGFGPSADSGWAVGEGGRVARFDPAALGAR